MPKLKCLKRKKHGAEEPFTGVPILFEVYYCVSPKCEHKNRGIRRCPSAKEWEAFPYFATNYAVVLCRNTFILRIHKVSPPLFLGVFIFNVRSPLAFKS